jgi:hypothetical protein
VLGLDDPLPNRTDMSPAAYDAAITTERLAVGFRIGIETGTQSLDTILGNERIVAVGDLVVPHPDYLSVSTPQQAQVA